MTRGSHDGLACHVPGSALLQQRTGRGAGEGGHARAARLRSGKVLAVLGLLLVQDHLLHATASLTSMSLFDSAAKQIR